MVTTAPSSTVLAVLDGRAPRQTFYSEWMSLSLLRRPPSADCSCHACLSLAPPQLSEPSQVQGAAFALQRGVDALLLRPNDDLWAEAVDARKKRSEKAGPSGSSADLDSSASSYSSLPGGSRDHRDHDPQGTRVALSVGSVTGTKAVGVGDRVCVDLIQSLSNGEGMLVGSSAKLLALVHAETFDTGFVPARWVDSCAHYNTVVLVARTELSDGSSVFFVFFCLFVFLTVIVDVVWYGVEWYGMVLNGMVWC